VLRICWQKSFGGPKDGVAGFGGGGGCGRGSRTTVFANEMLIGTAGSPSKWPCRPDMTTAAGDGSLNATKAVSGLAGTEGSSTNPAKGIKCWK